VTYKLVIALCLLALPAVAKQKQLSDYPDSYVIRESYRSNVSIEVFNQYVNGYGCVAVVSNENRFIRAASTAINCDTFPLGSQIRAKFKSYLGVPVIEFAWEQGGKVKSQTFYIQHDMYSGAGTAHHPQGSPQTNSPGATVQQAAIEVKSVPEGADIELDGSYAGNTPSTITIAAGERVVKLTKAGYKDWERKIKVTPGQITISAELQPETKGDEPNPAGNSQSFDRATLTGQTSQNHSQPAANTSSASTTIAEAATQTASQERPNTAEEALNVFFSSIPSGAAVEVDGQRVANTPSLISLPRGAHSITMTKEGFDPWRETINIATADMKIKASLKQASVITLH